MNKILQNLQPGHRVVITKSKLGLIQHHAIYLGADINGEHWFAENDLTSRVIITDSNDFLKNASEIARVENRTGDDQGRQSSTQTALSLTGPNTT